MPVQVEVRVLDPQWVREPQRSLDEPPPKQREPWQPFRDQPCDLLEARRALGTGTDHEDAEHIHRRAVRLRVQKHRIVLDVFSVETGEVTPTLKLKRSVITKNHSDLIEDMYA